MIVISAFEISGTYNGSDVERGLQRLQQQLNALKAPKITPQVDMSNFFNQMDKSASYATQGRMSKLFSGVDFGGIGRQAGSQYATSFMAGLGPIGGAASDLAMAIGPIGLAAGVAAAGIALIGAKSVQAAAAWESMATSIGRTTGLEGKNLTSLMDSLQELRMEMGITREAAAGLVEQAGSIGVGQAWLDKGDVVAYKNELLDFARSTAMLQGAWGMSAEATSAGIGKMGSVTIGAWNAQRRAMGEQELSWSEYAETVGGKVDSLANTMGSSEEEIVTAMRNASSAVASYAPTEETYGKWLALSSFLIDTGSSAGEAGTQIERMAKGAKQHGAELAAILGMDKNQFQESLKEDFVGTFQAIAEELASMPEGDRPDMIQLLGIEGSGAMDKMIADVKSGVGKLNKAIKLDPSNITEGFEKVADDANTAFARIGQAAQVSFEQMGGVILPIVTDIANAVADAWQGANEAGRELWKAGGGIVSNLLQGNLGDVTINGEMYNVSLSGIRKKTAEEIAAGAKEGADEASSEVAESLTSDISEKVASELEEAAKLVNAGVSKEIAGIMAAFNVSDMQALDTINAQTKSKHEYGGLWGRGSGTIVADEEGINYQIYYSNDKIGTTSYLYIDGQRMGETREASSKEAAIQDLFSQASARDKLTETLSLKLQGRGGEAALITETVDVELDFDVDVATKNAREELGKFSQNMDWGEYLFGDRENTVLGDLEWASNIGDDVAKAAVDAIGTALQDITPENYPKLVTGIEALNQKYGDMWSGFGPRSDVYTKLQSQYADAVLAGIIDAKDLMEAESAETKTLLSDSLRDGAIWGAERGALEAKKIWLDLLKENYPVEFKAEGLDKLAADIQTTLDGKPYTIDVKAEIDSGEFEANFALWKKDHAALYEKIYATTGQIPTSSEQEERYKYEQKLAEEGSESSKNILKWLGEWDAAVANSDYSSYDAIGKRLMELDPNLANQKWFTQTLETATKDVTANFQVLNGQLIPLGDSAKTLAGQFADAAAIIAVANGSLQSSAMQARGAVAMEGWRNIVSQVNTVGHLKTTPIAKTEPLKLNIKDYRDVGRFNIPALAEGGKVTGSGLAWIGEAGTEYVIPEEDLKGLYPESANVDKGSMSYLTGGRYFEDYPHTVRSESYRRSQFPNAPPVITTGNQPTAWLSDPQTTGNEWISGEIRAAQLRAMGLTEDNVLKSPKVARELTNRDMWNAIYDNSGTCIAFVEPDPSLNFYPGKDYMPGGKGYGNLDKPIEGYSGGSYGNLVSAIAGGVRSGISGGSSSGQWLTDKDAIAAAQGTSNGLVMPSGAVSDALTNRTAWNAIYDNSGTCIAFVEPDPSLNFTPGKDYLPGGKGLGNMGGGYTSLGDQEISSWDSVAEESIKTAKATEETAKSSEETAKNTKMIGTAISEVAGGLVMGGGYGSGGSSILGLANRGGAALWGGTSVSGMGGWVGSGRSATGWGAQAVSGSSGSFGGSSGWGSVKWAEGGFADGPVYGVFGEAGREAFVPISDRAAGLRILPRVMQELGVATFARGGIVGSGGSSGAIGGVTLNYAPKIQGAGMSEGQLKRMLKESSNDLMRQVEKQFYKEKR